MTANDRLSCLRSYPDMCIVSHCSSVLYRLKILTSVLSLSETVTLTDKYDHGVVFYTKNEEVVGIVLWNLISFRGNPSRIDIARQVRIHGDDVMGKYFNHNLTYDSLSLKYSEKRNLNRTKNKWWYLVFSLTYLAFNFFLFCVVFFFFFIPVTTANRQFRICVNLS